MPFLIAALAALGLTPLLIAAAPRLGLVDRPGALKVHASPIPLAGAAVAIAAGIGVLGSDMPGRRWLLVAVVIAVATGLLDDLRALGSAHPAGAPGGPARPCSPPEWSSSRWVRSATPGSCSRRWPPRTP